MAGWDAHGSGQRGQNNRAQGRLLKGHIHLHDQPWPGKARLKGHNWLPKYQFFTIVKIFCLVRVCNHCIWVCTWLCDINFKAASIWFSQARVTANTDKHGLQKEIVEFAEKHRARIYERQVYLKSSTLLLLCHLDKCLIFMIHVSRVQVKDSLLCSFRRRIWHGFRRIWWTRR